MAQTVARQTAMSDEDDISLTSTESEDYGSDAEFTVDRILAEKGPAKNKYYLISWEGYPEAKSTWEPQANVGSDTLEEWGDRLEREQRGLDEPFDVDKFEALVKRLKDEKEDRHKRREAKRRRIKAAKLEAMAEKRRTQAVKNDSDSSSEAIEENEVENAPGMEIKGAAKRRQLGTKQQFKRPIRHANHSTVDDNLSDAEVDTRAKKRTAGMTARSPAKSKQRQSDSSSEDVPLAKQKDAARPRPTTSSRPAVQQRKPAEVLAKAARPSLPASKVSPENLPPRGRLSARGGKGATRGGSNMVPKNVFQSRESKEQAKTERNPLKTAMDPSKDPKAFSNMRQRYLAEKQGRNLADRAPDLEATGGLFDPSKPLQPINPTTLRKSTKKRADSEQPSSELFIPAHAPVSQLPEALPAPTYQYSRPKSSRQVCFFWHRNQQNSLEPGCVNKYDCGRYHYYEPGAEISTAPPNYVWLESKSTYSGPDVCWFWHRNQLDPLNPACNNGDSCPRLHEYKEGAPINPPPGFVYPPGEVPPQSADQAQDDLPMSIDDDDFSHHDKPDIPPPWEEPVAPSSRPTHSTSRPKNTDIAPSRQEPTTADLQSNKLDVLPPWKESVAVGSERRPYRSTCFFWDLAQNNASNFCKQGSNCTYVHAYEPGVPIAPPPAGWVGPSQHSRSVIDDPVTDKPQVRFQSALGPVTGSMDSIASSSSINSSRIVQPSGPPERPPWDPSDPSYAICHFWYERGTCTKGNNCTFFHNLDEHLPVAPAIHEQQRIKRQTLCRDWETGNCSRADCWYMHKPRTTASAPDRPERAVSRKVTFDEAVPFTDEQEAMPPGSEEFGDRYFRGLPPTDLLSSLIQSSQRKVSRPSSSGTGTASPRQDQPEVESSATRLSAQPKRRAWSPRDASNAICHFWHKGSCMKPDCEYLHSTDPTLPIAPHPFDIDARTTCPLWAEKRCPKSDDECPYLHENTNFVPSRGRGTSSHDIYRQQEPAVTQMETPTGPRTKSVRFADEPSTAEPKHISRTDSMASSDTASFGRDGDSRTVCRFFKQGYCMRGTTCHYMHEDPSRQAQSYRDLDHEMLDAPHEISTGSNQDPLPFNRMARNDRPQSDAVVSNADADADIDMLRSEVTQLDVGQPVAGLPSQSSAQAKRKKVSLGGYRKQKALASVGERAKNVVFGYDEIHSAFFDFGEVESDQDPWKQEFTSTTRFVFNQLCMAQDLKAQQGLLHRRALKQGSLQPADPNNPALLKFVDHVAEELALRVGGLLTACENFAILLYPSKREEWSFLEQSSSVESRLRYLIFKHDFKPETQHLPAKLEFGEPYRTLLVDKIQGMRLKNLLPVYPKGQNPYKFFLMFPSSEKQMVEIFSAWILASHAESQIFDSLSEGSWDYFVKNTDGFGVILIHESIAASLHQLISLNRILKHSGIVIWNVSDSTSLYPLFPSTLCGPDPHVGRLRFTRLFPHGCAFLLTPSFIIAEPEHSYEILNWFLNKKMPSATAGTWKLVCCHDFTGYLLDLANSKAKEKEDFEQEHKDKPAKDSMLYQKKLDFRHCETRYKLYKALVTWQLSHTRDDSDSDSDRNDDNENPLVQAPKSIDQDDEEGLINWFAGWSMLKLDTYRKFPVIGTNSRNASLATRIKEVTVPKSAATTATTTMAQAVDSVPSPASLQKQKGLEIAARLGAAGPNMMLSDDSDVSMDLADTSPVSISSITKHGIDTRQSQDVLTFIAQTGCGPEDAQRLLAKANGDLTRATQYHRAEDFGSQFVELLRSKTDQGRQLPPLSVGESDLQRAQELLASPAVQRRPSEQSVPDGVFSPQFDGPDSRPHSSGTEGSTSRAGIATAENGKRFMPRSVHPSNAICPEHPVRPGFVPDDDRALYHNNRVVDGVPQYEVGASRESSKDVSRRASLVMSPGEMSLGSHEGENGNGSDRRFKRGRFEPVQEPQPQAQLQLYTETETETETESEAEMETVSTTKSFNATSAWYRELQAKDLGWQHVTVFTQWEEAKKYLGIS